MAPAADTATTAAEQQEHEANESDDNPYRPQNRNPGNETDEHENEPDNDHASPVARSRPSPNTQQPPPWRRVAGPLRKAVSFTTHLPPSSSSI